MLFFLIYQVIFYCIQPLIWLRLLYRSFKNSGYRKRIFERYGFCRKKVRPGGIVLHSVSVGETLAAVPLVRALKNRYPNLPITITTMTPTGSERVLSAFGKEVSHVYLPYDLWGSIRRFLNSTRPRIVIIMETELWPNLIYQLHKRKIPLIIANARLSERSYRGYSRIRPLMKPLLRQTTLLCAQHQSDAERFIDLGLRRSQITITGSIKFDISITPDLAARAVTLRRQWAPNRPIWIAASTHQGEDEIIFEAHKSLLLQFPNLLLIVVPRHPERFSKVKQLADNYSLSYITRQSGMIPEESTQVIVADTMGELLLLYGVADIAFVGGSLVEVGGHNPLEAAAHALPVIMGPHVFNFTAICKKLSSDQALLIIHDKQELVKKITNLLNDADYRRYFGRNAVEVIEKNHGALEKLLESIEPYLPQRRH
ncbi:lipid IV(A) 3-deoxy-D-manno-octulosonic acid transferase [Thorsellia kenyensis]|uniref:3-deoxy-D-manno-octulosonic acid transferase n=1 Tax=Thorsellia kenyensis TaxID=1549888 RepID=A0ABV6C9U2_9GAMM